MVLAVAPDEMVSNIRDGQVTPAPATRRICDFGGYSAASFGSSSQLFSLIETPWAPS